MTPSIIFKSHQELNDYKGSNNNLDYIDHELSVNLDSTDAFEGPEKLLELWFSPSATDLPPNWPINGLRAIPRNEIEKLLDVVHCEILSKISSPIMDAYLLSESSLFVYPNKFILKTCGTTTTLLCFDKLKELIQLYCHNDNGKIFDNIYRIFYSRRSFMFPERQKSVHKSWELELNYLHQYFDESTSKSYILGDSKTIEGSNDENWYLYINGNNEFKKYNEKEEDINKKFSTNDFSVELIMTDLDVNKSLQFQLSSNEDKFKISNPDTEDAGHLLGEYMMKEYKLDKIIHHEEIKHDGFAFTPCGFSSNSIIEEDKYYTIHITPERGWSYASFETNYKPQHLKEFVEMIRNVLRIVKPEKFALIVFNENSEFEIDLNELDEEYNCENVVRQSIEHGYGLIYSMYSSKLKV